MLRASIASTGSTGSTGNEAAVAGGIDSGLPFGHELVALAEAAVDPAATGLAAARDRLRRAAGSAFVNDAAAVIANFEMMTRVADLTGAALDQSRRDALAPTVAVVGASEFSTLRWG